MNSLKRNEAKKSLDLNLKLEVPNFTPCVQLYEEKF